MSSVTALSLYQIEENLLALLDTEEMVPEEQQAEFQAELAEQLKVAVDKRERVGQFLRFCELQSANCDAEIQRLQARKKSFLVAQDRMEQYIVKTIESMGKDAKGKWQKLTGHSITLSLAAKPSSVDITDEALVPNDFKSISITLPVTVWNSLTASLPSAIAGDIEKANAAGKVSIAKTPIKKAIEEGGEVPGADIKIGDNRLVVK